jgi:MFS family permease
MNEKRYKNQYKSLTKVDPSTGKETRVYQYTGKYYRFAAEKRLVHAAWRWITFCTGFFWIGFIAGGLINAPGSRSLWVLPFFLLSVFPGFYAVLAVWNLFRLPEYITVPQKKNSLDSVKNSAWGIVILGAPAAVGSLILLLTGAASGQEAEELIFLGFSMLRLLAGWGMLHKLKSLLCEETIPPSK